MQNLFFKLNKNYRKQINLVISKNYNGLTERPTHNIISHLHIIGVTVTFNNKSGIHIILS